MTKLKKYIKDTLGIEINANPLQASEQNALPFYICEMYKIKTTGMFNREVLFVKQTAAEKLTTDQYRKHITLIENVFNLPAVLVFEQLEAYNRKRLIEKKIAFIVPNKQMYIPQLLIDLKEFRDRQEKKREKLMPATQALLFYHLLKENLTEINFKTIAKITNYAQMTITRIVKDLEKKQLCNIQGIKEKKLFLVKTNKHYGRRRKFICKIL